ncbi:MAG TPA: CerR family C-terminal domain-containing protein [Steroidobacter sp.]|uniref:CerR family C-terminal domain-containing protein n=1 Tax=Steroidobacter sp. TaxID=1978227 RepID=UPI002EDB1085
MAGPRSTRRGAAKQRPAAGRTPARAARRENGAQTRQKLLEVAGRVFAERGYLSTTSKEICELAEANIAAVNYHFGGKDALYSAVLEEAHARLVSIDSVAEITQSNADSAAKLRLLLRKILVEVARRGADAWELRVIGRELIAPTSLMDAMMKNQVVPKAKMVMGMIADILGVPATHPAVARSTVNIVSPCVFLLVVSSERQKKVFPALHADPDELVDHMVAFTLGGLRSVAEGLQRSAR